MKTRVRLFGRFRKYVGTDTHIEIEQASDLSVAEVKALIASALKLRNPDFADEQLLADSALATEETVLSTTDQVRAGREIAILPPVCGG